MKNENKHYYRRKYVQAVEAELEQRDQIVREAWNEIINRFIELLNIGSTWVVIDKQPAQLCGPNGKPYIEEVGSREKALRDFEKLLEENKTLTWDHSKDMEKICKILFMADFIKEGRFIICKNRKDACIKAGWEKDYKPRKIKINKKGL